MEEGEAMIKTVLNVDNICQDCPYFSMETEHSTNYAGMHMIYIFCEHRDLCNHIRKHIEKEMNMAEQLKAGVKNE